ncbi:metallophosphoesterase family protein [Candidatus Sumerlaeota bacterium]|nr:metallophosphoesterase family protein [Candidatus Sumerlaeota bacterium]
MKLDNGNARRVGVISDIHGNLEALEAVLTSFAEARVDRIFCCGDVVGYGASPNECIELLRRREIPTVLGNHDAAVLNDDELVFFNEMARDAALWTRGVLTEESRRWLSSLPMTISRYGSLFVHASPTDPAEWNYVLTYGEARRAFKAIEEPLCFLGHSHQPFFITLRFGEIDHIREDVMTLGENTSHLVNVGSVGQPRDRDPRASSVIWDLAQGTITLNRVEYDVARAQQKIRMISGHATLAERLARGE